MYRRKRIGALNSIALSNLFTSAVVKRTSLSISLSISVLLVLFIKYDTSVALAPNSTRTLQLINVFLSTKINWSIFFSKPSRFVDFIRMLVIKSTLIL